MACWLNSELEAGQSHGPGRDLSKLPFRKKVVNKKPGLCKNIVALGTLGDAIEEHRNIFQHRGSSPLRFRADSEKLNEKGGWYLITEESRQGPQLDLRLTDLLQYWVRLIEKNLFLCHHEVLCSGTSVEDYDEICRKKRAVESVGSWTVPLQLDCPYHS